MEDFERELKVVVVGNGGVGKTSMIRRFCRGAYTDEYKKTIGVDFLEKQLYVSSLGEDVRCFVWDTAGQEEFDSITKTYYRGAGAAVITFSTVDRASFDAVPAWRDKLAAECGDIAMALVQNKVDLLDQAVVTPAEAEAMARRLGLKFYRTCVRENLNVTEVFTYLVELHDKKLAAGTLGAELAPLSSQPAAWQQNHTGVATAHTPNAAASAAPAAAAQPAAGGLGAARQRSQPEAPESTAVGTLGMSPLTASRKRIDTAGKPAAPAAAAPAADKGPAPPAGAGAAGSSHLPAEVVLAPTTRRGKKGLKHKLNKAKAKLTGEACTIM